MTTRRHLVVFPRSIQRHPAELRIEPAGSFCDGNGAFPDITTPRLLLHFLRRASDSDEVEVTSTPTLQQALFWMNIYRDLLAVDENALQRMRVLITEGMAMDRSEIYYQPDVELVIGEIERVRARLDHWLGLVDRMS
jgi:hypothetical protein